MLNLFQPQTGTEELTALSHTLSTHWLGKGPKVQEFESAWARQVGVWPTNMVSTNSCTSALFEAVRLAKLEPQDEVIIPSIHFVGAAQAVRAVGAIPVFCDVDRTTLNATHEMIEDRITSQTRAVIMNHYGGVIAEVGRTDLADLIWIDDLANAPTAKIATLGTCDFACWSFDAMKIITTGDGGMLYCANERDATQARQDFCLGVNSESGMSSTQKSRWWEFSVPFPGMRRELMNDLQAAMGLEQLQKLPQFVSRRLEIVGMYELELGGKGSEFHYPILETAPYYFTWLYSDQRDDLAQFLREQGIYTSFRYWPLHYAYNQALDYYLPNAEWLAKHTLNLPLHQALSDEDVLYICDTIKKF